MKSYEKYIDQKEMLSSFVSSHWRNGLELSESAELLKEWVINYVFDRIKPTSILV